MEEFGIGTSTVQWITTGYLLILAMIIPASSYLKKRFTLKKLFVTAICLFLIGTIMAAVTPVFSLLLLGRLIQGVGTGIALPLMFNIVLEQVPAKKLGLMMGIASLITAMAPAVGPSVGGMLVSNFGWRMIFISLIPLLLLSFFLGVFSIRQVTETEKISFQWLDYIFLAAGFACFIFATSTASEAGWISVQVLGLLAASIICIVISLCSLQPQCTGPCLYSVYLPWTGISDPQLCAAGSGGRSFPGRMSSPSRLYHRCCSLSHKRQDPGPFRSEEAYPFR